MSGTIIEEVVLLSDCILLGVLFTAVYEGIGFFRWLVRHHTLVVAVEDFAYWCVTALLLFRFLCNQNSGLMRGFALGGVLLGVLSIKLIKKALKSIGEEIRMRLPGNFMRNRYGKQTYEKKKKE